MNNVRKYSEYQHMPFIINELEDIPGGGSLKMADLDKSQGSIAPGFFVGRDATTGLLLLCVSAVVVADALATDKKLKVRKGSQLKAAMVVAGDVTGSKAYGISSIDRSHADYDEVTLPTALGVALSVNDTIYEVTEVDAEGGQSTIPVIPIGVAKQEIDLSKSHVDTGVSVRGSYTVATMAFGAPSAYTKHLPLMRFKEPNAVE